MALLFNQIKDYASISSTGTGSHFLEEDLHTREVNVGNYTIIVRLTKDNKFVGVSEVKINSPELWKRKSSIGFVDVNDEYPE